MLLGTPFDAAAAAAGPALLLGGDGDERRGSKSQLVAASEATGPITAARLARQRGEEVRDTEGRQRFHGAFTGGFSAGYFNSVGSKEGWMPATFTSRRGAAPAAAADDGSGDGGAASAAASFSTRVQDIMDEEDQQSLTTLGAAEAYDTMGFAGLRKGRSLAAAATGAKASAPVDGGGSLVFGGASLLPAELVVATSTPIGRQLLQAAGWRGGQPLGSRPPPTSTAPIGSASAANASSDALVSSLWKASSNVISGGRHHGIGYVPSRLGDEEVARGGGSGGGGSNRSSTAAADAAPPWRSLISGASLSDGGDAEETLGGGRLLMDGSKRRAAVAASLGAAASSGVSVAAKTGRKTSATAPSRLLSFASGRIGFDDEGDDDIAYDDDDDGGAGGSRRHATSMLALEDQRAKQPPLLLRNERAERIPKPPAAGGIDPGVGDSKGIHPHSRLHGSDGRPPLPGFHVAQAAERSFLRYAKQHPLPVVPPGWRPIHTFEAPRSSALHIQQLPTAYVGGSHGGTPLMSGGSVLPAVASQPPRPLQPPPPHLFLQQQQQQQQHLTARHSSSAAALPSHRGLAAAAASVTGGSSSNAAGGLANRPRPPSQGVTTGGGRGVRGGRSGGGGGSSSSSSSHPASEAVSLAASVAAMGDRFQKGVIETSSAVFSGIASGGQLSAAPAVLAADATDSNGQQLSTDDVMTFAPASIVGPEPASRASAASTAAIGPQLPPAAASAGASASSSTQYPSRSSVGWLADGESRRQLVDWQPARLLCKRMNVPDPLTAEERRRADSNASSAAGGGSNSFGGGGGERGVSAAAGSASSGGEAWGGNGGGAPPRPAHSATAAGAGAHAMLRETGAGSRPPDATFESIFG